MREERKEYVKAHKDCMAVSIAITIVFILFGVFRFNGFVGRIIESIRDLGTSAAYYFCDVFEIEADVVATVTKYPKIPFFGLFGGVAPEIPIPKEIQAFIENWGVYWQLFVTKENITGYLSSTGETLLSLSRILIVALPFYVALRFMFSGMLKKSNNDYNKDSKALTRFRRIADATYKPVKRRIMRYAKFLGEITAFKTAWIILWLAYFNAFTILIEALAYYLYFVVSFDVVSL